jgi:hypothetical protein
MDVQHQSASIAKSSTYIFSKLPSLALDFGFPAKMTTHRVIMGIAAHMPKFFAPTGFVV